MLYIPITEELSKLFTIYIYLLPLCIAGELEYNVGAANDTPVGLVFEFVVMELVVIELVVIELVAGLEVEL